MDKEIKLEVCKICGKSISLNSDIYIAKDIINDNFIFYDFKCLSHIMDPIDEYFFINRVVKMEPDYKSYKHSYIILSNNSKHYKLRKRENMEYGLKVKHMYQVYIIQLLQEKITDEIFIKGLSDIEMEFINSLIFNWEKNQYMTNDSFDYIKKIFYKIGINYQSEFKKIKERIYSDDLTIFDKINISAKLADFRKWFNSNNDLTDDDKLEDYEPKEKEEENEDDLPF